MRHMTLPPLKTLPASRRSHHLGGERVQVVCDRPKVEQSHRVPNPKNIECKASTRSKLAQKEIVVIKEVACGPVQELLSQKFTTFVFYMILQELYD